MLPSPLLSSGQFPLTPPRRVGGSGLLPSPANSPAKEGVGDQGLPSPSQFPCKGGSRGSGLLPSSSLSPSFGGGRLLINSSPLHRYIQYWNAASVEGRAAASTTGTVVAQQDRGKISNNEDNKCQYHTVAHGAGSVSPMKTPSHI